MMSSISSSERLASPSGPLNASMRVLERPFLIVSRMKAVRDLVQEARQADGRAGAAGFIAIPVHAVTGGADIVVPLLAEAGVAMSVGLIVDLFGAVGSLAWDRR